MAPERAASSFITEFNLVTISIKSLSRTKGIQPLDESLVKAALLRTCPIKIDLVPRDVFRAIMLCTFRRRISSSLGSAPVPGLVGESLAATDEAGGPKTVKLLRIVISGENRPSLPTSNAPTWPGRCQSA